MDSPLDRSRKIVYLFLTRLLIDERRTKARLYRSGDLRQFFQQHRSSNFYFRRVLRDLLIVWLRRRGIDGVTDQRL